MQKYYVRKSLGKVSPNASLLKYEVLCEEKIKNMRFRTEKHSDVGTKQIIKDVLSASQYLRIRISLIQKLLSNCSNHFFISQFIDLFSVVSMGASLYSLILLVSYTCLKGIRELNFLGFDVLKLLVIRIFILLLNKF